MNQVLVDTSVWIDYFSGKKTADMVDSLLDDKLICTNKIIMCELLPFLHVRKEIELIDLLKALPEIILEIEWDKILEYQISILKRNIKRVGIPDLLILNNVVRNKLKLFTFDNSLLQLKSIIKYETI